jgi:histidinol dehydrogenase
VSLALAFRGAIDDLDPTARRRLLDRARDDEPGVRERVTAILERVRRDGDAALVALARELDGVTLDALEVPRARRSEALAGLDPELRRALERAARNLRTAHAAFRPRTVEVETEPGVRVARRPDPLARVGLYAPGGRAAYPSSVLMGAIPARVAGVGEIVLCSPPGPDGAPSSVVLAAAEIAGVDRVFAIGGAGAIAAMAFGTASVPRVDRIVGPGNAYVAEAKVQVQRWVGIDAPAGPSELMVIADAGASPAAVARELIAQAEHDPDAAAIAITLDAATACAIERALGCAIGAEPRAETIARALSSRGGVLSAGSLDRAIEIANAWAPEHLLLALADPEPALDRVRHAGAVFVGATSSVTFGDYLAGGNHTLPTGGTARSCSGLSTSDFVRWTAIQRVTPAAAARLAPDVATLARAEGLPAHARAALLAVEANTAAIDEVGATLVGRPEYRDLALYAPDRAPAPIDLCDNTNRFGVPPSARRALRELENDSVTRYPSAYAASLTETLARYAAVRPEEIVTGCGSDDVLDSAFRAFATPGDVVAFPDPTFTMIPRFARMNGLVPAAVPLTADHDLDVDGLLATGARLIYVCSPNNPTGASVRSESIARLVSGSAGVVFLDEAYAEFAGGGWIGKAPGLERLLVVRTLSKAFGLAGLRIGYAAGSAALVAEVQKSRGPYKVSTTAERAAVAALEHDREWVTARIDEVRAERERFAAALRAIGMSPLPSDANFVLVPVADAVGTARRMREHGVAVRPFPGLVRFGDALRVTIGPRAMMDAALAALREAVC